MINKKLLSAVEETLDKIAYSGEITDEKNELILKIKNHFDIICQGQDLVNDEIAKLKQELKIVNKNLNQGEVK